MIIIDVKKEKSLDSALKKLKYKFSKNKVKEQLFEKREFTKKSIKRREEIKKAKYKEHIKDKAEKNS
jgi:small subunit ribosomal protein S21